jgi:hypothetical protein
LLLRGDGELRVLTDPFPGRTLPSKQQFTQGRSLGL